MSLNPALLAMVKGAKNKYSVGSRSVKLKEGRTTVRILQKTATDIFWADLGVHWIKTEKDGKPVAVVGCESDVHSKPCAICTAIDKSSKAVSDDESLEIVKEWKSKKAVLVNALIRSGSDASENPVVLELTPTTFGTVLGLVELYANQDDGAINILDPNTGIDLIIERTGKGLNTKYTVMAKPGASKPVPVEAFEKLVNLQEWIDKEFFRGDEPKALAAIQSITGVSVKPAIAGPKNAGLLTSATVDDAVIEEVAAELEEAPATPAPAPAKPIAAPAAAKPAAAKTVASPATAPAEFGEALNDTDIESMLSELDDVK